eukprot:1483682-Alexandrium_andersonii.AAC.1
MATGPHPKGPRGRSPQGQSPAANRHCPGGRSRLAQVQDQAAYQLAGAGCAWPCCRRHWRTQRGR